MGKKRGQAWGLKTGKSSSGWILASETYVCKWRPLFTVTRPEDIQPQDIKEDDEQKRI